MDASSNFSGAALSFNVTGEGVAIDPATGTLSIATDKLLAGATITVTVTNSGGSAVGRFQLDGGRGRHGAVLSWPPRLVGAADDRGDRHRSIPGNWGGVPAPDLALQWLVDGGEIPGAVRRSTCRFRPTTAARSPAG